MERQLMKNALSEPEAQAAEPQPILPVEELRIEDLESILSGTRRGFFEHPAYKRMEIAARVAARLLADFLAITLAAWLAYWLRFESTFMLSHFPPENMAAISQVFFPLLLFSPILLLSLKGCGMYDTRTRVRILDRIPRTVAAVNVYVVSLLIASFLLNTTVLTRGFLVFFWGFSILFLFAGRSLLQFLLSAAGIKDIVMRNTLIVGSGNVGKEVARKLLRHETFGLRPVGFIDDDPLYTVFREPELRGLRVLGRMKDLCHIIGDFNVEKVVIAFSVASSEDLLNLASKCNKLGVECSIVPRLFEVITDEIKVTEIGGIPLIRLREKKVEGYKRFLKALEDYLLAAIVLLLIWPLLLVTAIAIKLDSPGPVLFKQKRLGKDGKFFSCLKFRSMVDNADDIKEDLLHLNECEGVLFKIAEDPRVTRVGKWIRRFSIDELPQVFNVLAGHMSLVGPRPPVQEEVDLYKGWHIQRLNVKPGITGLWQVSGRSDLPFDEMVKLDLYYIETWSLWQDFKIIVRTTAAVFSCQGAY